MDVDVTEPISASVPLADRIRTQLSPSRIVAGVSTTVAVAAVGTLVWVVGHEPEKPAAESERPVAVAAAAPVPHAQQVAAHPAPSVIPDVLPSVTPSPKPPSRTTSSLPIFGGPSRGASIASRSEPVLPSLPEAPAELPTISWPQFDAAAVQPPWSTLIDTNAQNTAGTIASSVSGGVGGIGGGALDFLGAVITAANYGNQNSGLPSPDGLTALMLGPAVAGAGMPALPPPPAFDFTKLPPPPAFDFSKLPPPPSFDFSKLPPPPALPPPPPPPSFDNPLTKLPSITRAVGLPF
ncbi:hypothetical protein BN975_02033 [Mycolicibacterium farcinogenes]|uniref:Uncharacterized protein n=1 Tax=Mycolicibacterium senegalense TaxID=1796 RepID=A0A378W3S1_9MYCO|nr:hypothetical protein BN975_02033 [Mycolicibacterium farcinogenes]SUA27685.1 Uncharacterised protein [Mycolicibacterium senegalense]